MDASTQTTPLSSDWTRSPVTQSRGDIQPTREEHQRRWSFNGGEGRDIRDRPEPGFTSVRRNQESVVALPLSNGETSTTLSSSSSDESSDLDPMHSLELQKKAEAAILGPTDIVQAEGTHAAREDTASQVGGSHALEQSLRQRKDPQSQSEEQMEEQIRLVLTRQDSIVLQQENYLLKVCRALMMYGATTYRLEEYMHRTAHVLGLHLQSFYIPGCMIISFDVTIWRSKDVHIVRCTESLNLSKLDDVHVVYKDVIHKKITVGEAKARLDEIMTQSNKFPRWFLVLMYGLASAFIGPVSYQARPIDLPIIFMLGCLLGFMQLVVADRSELYRHVFEISTAILTSFIARAFGSIDLGPDRSFCFSAISQACLVMILPGFTITNSALELQSKNMVSGSVRMVYGIIFTLFLAFGITIGITIYGAMDSNATSATKCATIWPFWWQIIFVAPFAICYMIINQGKWNNAPATVILSLIGWVVSYFSAQRFSANAQIAQTLGALAVGILANIYSRLGYGLAVALLYPAIFIQVPGSLAASGSLIGGLKNADELNRGGSGIGDTIAAPNTAALQAGYAMIEIAIGITVGLSVSALVVYPFRKKGRSGLFSF